jgi:hypothetical protein
MSEFDRHQHFTLSFYPRSYTIFRQGLRIYTDWLEQWQAPGNEAIKNKIERVRVLLRYLASVEAKSEDSYDMVAMEVEGEHLVLIKSTLPYLRESLQKEKADLGKLNPPEEAFEGLDKKIEDVNLLMTVGIMKDVPVEQLMAKLNSPPPTTNPEDDVYDVALSFAGEDRKLVEAVAEALTSQGIRIFFDSYELANLWGKDLGQHLDEVFGKKAAFVMIFVSKDFVAKPWPQHEFRSALSTAILKKGDYILPIRLDGSDLPGLQASMAYINANDMTPEQIAALFVKKRAEKIANLK